MHKVTEKPLVTQISLGRFHHFHLARQLERHSLLEAIWTGYPQFQLRDETGIGVGKIKSFPWLQTPYMARGRIGLNRWNWLNWQWEWAARETLDKHVADRLGDSSVLIALSSMGLHAGRVMQARGGTYLCDRGSSHIRFQERVLREEHQRLGLPFVGIDPRIIAKEEAEYAQADLITVPSEFVRQSFIEMGVPAEKLAKVPYGANLSRFSRVGEPDPTRFRVLWVGGVGVRKGFLDLLAAFRQVRHPHKELIVVGHVAPEFQAVLGQQNLDGIDFRGIVPNAELPRMYSTAQVFVLPSLEEGLAMVQGEALACGCPVVASTNTGASDLFDDGVEGFIVPIRSPQRLNDRLQQLADDPPLQQRMSEAALRRVRSLGGWDSYGDSMQALVTMVCSE